MIIQKYYSPFLTFVALLILSFPALALEANPLRPLPVEESKKTAAHVMSSVLLPIGNSSFDPVRNADGVVQYAPWVMETQKKSKVLRDVGYAGKMAVVIKSKKTDDDDVYDRISTDLPIPVQWQEGRTSFSVSVWVWSNKPLSAFLQITSDQGKIAVSDYHSGSGTWEYLTVAYPFFELSGSFKITLANKDGTAKFSDIRPLIIFDDRFENIPNACRPFREKVSYHKGDRIRIVIVGNSTINGIHASRNATFPYVLQAKLESLYPNAFEVINFGLCAWNLASQIVTVDTNFHFSLACAGGKADWCNGEYIDHKNVFQQVADATFTNREELVTLKSLKPDIIILGSMWNDIWRVLKTREYGLATPFPDEATVVESVPFSVLYLQSIYNYAQEPSYANYLISDSLYKFTTRTTEPLPVTYEDYVKSIYFKKLSSMADLKYSYLLRTFISKSSSWTKIWNISLPSKFGRGYEKLMNHLLSSNIVEKEKYESSKINAYIDNTAEQIQNRVIEELSNEYNMPFINLSNIYHRQYDKISPGALMKLDYFINDNVHFAYRGNEFLADRLFMQMKDEFSRLAEEFHRGRPSHE